MALLRPSGFFSMNSTPASQEPSNYDIEKNWLRFVKKAERQLPDNIWLRALRSAQVSACINRLPVLEAIDMAYQFKNPFKGATVSIFSMRILFLRKRWISHSPQSGSAA